MHRLIKDIAEKCPEFHHIDPSRVLAGITIARKRGRYGLHAQIMQTRSRDKRLDLSEWSGLTHDGREMLYVIEFCLPRFQNLGYPENLDTVFHELYHISPAFDGDIRRFAGRNRVHSSSKKYDALMAQFRRDYLSKVPATGPQAFLKYSFLELSRRYGDVVGLRVRGRRRRSVGRTADRRSG